MAGIGQTLKHIRQRAGKTQEEVARQLKVSVNTVARWEQGVHEPSLATLREVADLLGTTVAKLVKEGH